MKLYARLLPRMPRPGAPVCNWWAALGQFFFSSGRSKLPAWPHVVVVAPRRALRGPHGSRIAGCRPRTQRPRRCALTREAGRERARCGIQSARAWSLSARRARETGRGSLTRSAHVARSKSCRGARRGSPPTPARRWKRSSTPRRRSSPPRPPRRRRPTAAPRRSPRRRSTPPRGGTRRRRRRRASGGRAGGRGRARGRRGRGPASFVPAAAEDEEDSLAPSAELYDCEKGCGYRGTFDDVELHEQTCKYPDVTPPATVEEESQEETLNTAQLDLSDLFNASALTNLFQGLQHQLKHQQKRLGQLESATHELEAARLAHAAGKRDLGGPAGRIEA